MSMLLGPQTFEERLELAFRGDAGEQRKARKGFLKKRREALGLDLGPGRVLGTPGQPLRGSNIFKSNLGGTNRLTR